MRFELTGNPIVVRAFRVGFRPGASSFRIAIWGVALLAILLWSVYRFVFFEELGVAGVADELLSLLVFYTAGTFLIGGLHRMLVSFSQERERGTFDFLHLSTMKPGSLVWGFLLAGQLPGYLLLVLTVPIQIVAAFLAGFDVLTLITLLCLLAGYVVLLSLLLLLIGFWMRKVTDLRGGVPVVVTLLVFVATGISMNKLPSQFGQWEAVGVLGGFPVLHGLWKQGWGAPGLTLEFFGAPVPTWIVAVITLTPVAALVFWTLSRALRYRERKPISDGGVLGLVVWSHFVFTALYWGSWVSFDHKVGILAVGSWVGMGWLHGRVVRPLGAVTRRLVALGGDRRALVLDPEGPPYRLSLLLALELLVVGLAQILGTTLPGESGTAVTARQGLSILLLPLPLVVFFWLQQLLAWRGRWGKVLNGTIQALVVWLPFALFLFLEPLSQLLPWVDDGLGYLCALSPFTQIQVLATEGTPRLDPALANTAVLLFQGGYLLAAVVLGFGHAARLKKVIVAGDLPIFPRR